MSTVIDKNGQFREKQRRKYSVITLNINSVLTSSPRKRLLNFYSTIRHNINEIRTDESL